MLLASRSMYERFDWMTLLSILFLMDLIYNPQLLLVSHYDYILRLIICIPFNSIKNTPKIIQFFLSIYLYFTFHGEFLLYCNRHNRITYISLTSKPKTLKVTSYFSFNKAYNTVIILKFHNLLMGGRFVILCSPIMFHHCLHHIICYWLIVLLF